MPAPLTQQDLERYGNLLSEIKARVEHASKILVNVSERFDLESAALQLRKTIELIMMAAMAVNRQNASAVSSTLHKKNWNEARKLLEKLNPNFWPEPFEDRSITKSTRSLVAVTEPYLSKDDAGREWGFLSELLHASNPFGSPSDDHVTVQRLRDIVTRTSRLLGLHTLDLGGREHLILATMSEPRTGDVVAIVLNG